MTTHPDEMQFFLGGLTAEDRDAFVNAIADVALRDRVRALLVAHDEVSGTGAQGRPAFIRSLSLAESLIGVSFDGYRIVGVLGRGGMGVVFEAEQAEPKRRVALKTVHSALAADDALERLMREGRFLARISHPGVAHIYGVGRASALDGLPYIAMELIDGRPIDVSARERGLGVPQRLALLAEVAETVSHLHTRGLVHRDLKPANVLVDREGRTKILDFGIARLCTSDESLDVALTRAGEIIGTLGCMSPEQVLGDVDLVDGRTDVYALGVLAYELLAGRPPIDVSRDSVPRAIHRIAEEEPPALGLIAQNLDRDVVTAVAKAMRKRPDDRYATAAEFAEDLRRILAHEPILARPPSRGYRLRKFVRRNRFPAAFFAGIFLSLALGMTWALSERSAAVAAQRIEQSAKLAAHNSRLEALRSEERAQLAAGRDRLRAASTTRLNHLLSRIVAQATPQEHGGRSITAREMVDDLARDLALGAIDDPYTRARTHLVLCDARKKAGRLPLAREHLEHARTDFAESPLTAISDHIDLAVADAECAKTNEEVRAAIMTLRNLLPQAQGLDDHGASERKAAFGLANLLASRRLELNTAETHARRACALSVQLHGERSITYAGDLHALAFVLTQASRFEEAIATYERVVALRRALQPDSLSLATALQNLGLALHALGRLPQALAACEEAVALKRDILGQEVHLDLMFGLDALAIVLRDLGRLGEALPLFEEAAQGFRAIRGSAHEDLAICLTEWAIALRYAGQTEPARSKVEEALRIHESQSGGSPPALAATLEQLGNIAIEGNDPELALRHAARAIELREAFHGRDHPLVAQALAVRSTALLILGHHSEALIAGERIFELRRQHYGLDDARTWEDAALVYAPLAKLGRLTEARKFAERAHTTLHGRLGQSHSATQVARMGLAKLYRLEGMLEQAAALEASNP